MICNPTGNLLFPSLAVAQPQGTLRAGCPVALNWQVLFMAPSASFALSMTVLPPSVTGLMSG